MVALLVLALVAFLSAGALAAVEAGFDLSWWTVDGGGGTASGAGYQVSGTLGQPDAGPALSAGGYQLTGGYWSGAAGPGGSGSSQLYLPVVIR